MKTISFDVMGNDNGVKAAVTASLSFLKDNKDYRIILVGDKNMIDHYLNDEKNIEVLHSSKVVDPIEGARSARKKESSMAKAIDLVVENKANIVLSSGDSGSYLSMTTLKLKRLNDIKRPAFMPVFPSIVNKEFVMLDCGANIETTSLMLAQWARMGSVFVKIMLKVKKPKVGLINIGVEDTKGKDFHLEADKLIKDNKKINYLGFIEPRDLLKAKVDVALIDGYGGNLILKNMEGSVMSLFSLIKKEIKSKIKYKMGALLAKGAFDNVKETLDYRNAGGAWILGLNGLAVKTHGNADYKSYIGALNKIKEALDRNLLESFKKAMCNG